MYSTEAVRKEGTNSSRVAKFPGQKSRQPLYLEFGDHRYNKGQGQEMG